MLHHQDQPLNSAHRGRGGEDNGASSLLRNRKGDKDGNFNFLPRKGDDGLGDNGGGDENRNQVRPSSLGPLGLDPPSSSPSAEGHHNPGILSPRPRLPCWSPLDPLPEIESVDDFYRRVPPDGAEEGRVEEEVRGVMLTLLEEEKQRHQREQQRRRSRGREEEEDDDTWDDSDSESELSYRSGGNMSPLNMDGGGKGMLMGGWDRVGVGEPKSNQRDIDPTTGNRDRGAPVSRGSFSRKSLTGNHLRNLLEDGAEVQDDDDRSSDSDGEPPELTDAVWTLRDRERFKAQEMEKHQAQLTMYRRLALIRWVRTLQSRIQEQQNRLQSSFDIILTQRKELLRMGGAAATAAVVDAAPPVAAVSQS